MTETENGVVIASTLELSRKPALLDPEVKNQPFILVPDGYTFRDVSPDLDKWRDSRLRPRGFCRIDLLDSFIGYVKRHLTPATAIYMDASTPAQPVLTAVFNGTTPQSNDHDYGDFGAVYKLGMSPEWKAWMAAQTLLGAKQFAELLEDRIVDVMAPETVKAETKEVAALQGITLATQQRLQTLARGVEVSVDQKVKAQQNLDTGESVIHFEESHTDTTGAPLKLPNGFAIAIPVLTGGPAYAIIVRLRHRVRDQKLAWLIKLQRTDNVLRLVLTDAIERIEKETGLPVFWGAPAR